MGPRDGRFLGEGAEKPGQSERVPIAGGGGMRRSEEARVLEAVVWRKSSRGSPRNWGGAKNGKAEELV
jgi:hypothetical protein